MGDEQLLDRIAAWEAAGLIDTTTAGRLAAFEQSAASARDRRTGRPALASLFGPAVSVGEMLAYLGAVFVLAAWHVFARASSADYSAMEDFGRQALQYGVPAVLLATVGVLLDGENARRSRAAGVSFVVATSHAAMAVWYAIQAADPGIGHDLLLLLAALAGLSAAAAFRRLHPAVLTQLGLLGAHWTVAAAGLRLLDHVIYPQLEVVDFSDSPPPDSGAGLLRVVLTAAWWLGWTAAFGAIALVEARTAATRSELKRWHRGRSSSHREPVHCRPRRCLRDNDRGDAVQRVRASPRSVARRSRDPGRGRCRRTDRISAGDERLPLPGRKSA